MLQMNATLAIILVLWWALMYFISKVKFMNELKHEVDNMSEKIREIDQFVYKFSLMLALYGVNK